MHGISSGSEAKLQVPFGNLISNTNINSNIPNRIQFTQTVGNLEEFSGNFNKDTSEWFANFEAISNVSATFQRIMDNFVTGIN